MQQGPFAFSSGCAHQGGGPQYPLKAGVSTQNCMTSIVASTGHSTSCGKPLNWTQLVSSISFHLSLPLVSLFFSYLLSLSLFPHVFTELQSYSGIDGKISAFLCELLGQDFSGPNHFVMEFNFIYKIRENEFCVWCAHLRFNKLLYCFIYSRHSHEWIPTCQPRGGNGRSIIFATMILSLIYLANCGALKSTLTQWYVSCFFFLKGIMSELLQRCRSRS